ncbi:MAG: flagellar biosynthesis protein FlhF [Chitinophagales bacterium]
MKIKRYVGNSFQEAMAKAKQEMGKDAIILYSRKFKEGGFMGLFGRLRFEITVAVDEEARTTLDVRSISQNFEKENVNGVGVPSETAVVKEATEYAEVASAIHDSLLDEIRSVKDMMEDLQQKVGDKEKNKVSSRSGLTLLKVLESNQVDEKLAMRIIKIVEQEMEKESCKEMTFAREVGLQVVSDLIKKPKPIEIRGKRARVVVLVGPTGVGKTTTIAKLAANFTLLEKKKVALITIDTYRIAAVEQLKTYAEIIGIPLEIVFNPDDFKNGVKKLKNSDLILVDTAGRNPRNDEQVVELNRFMETVNPDEIILVLSAATRTEDLLEAYRRFSSGRIDKIIFTKLDETGTYGQILTVLQKTRSQLSYVTNGQNVPDDIEIPDQFKLARQILGDDRVL